MSRRPPVQTVEQYMKSLFTRFIHDESGASAMEYSVIGTSIAVLLVVSLSMIGGKVNHNFGAASSGLP